MKKISDSQKSWNTISIPKIIKQDLFNLGQIINKRTIWKIIEYLLQMNKKFQKLRKTEEYRQMRLSGKIEDENIVIAEMKKIRSNQSVIWKELKEIKKGLNK